MEKERIKRKIEDREDRLEKTILILYIVFNIAVFIFLIATLYYFRSINNIFFFTGSLAVGFAVIFMQWCYNNN